MAGEQSEKVVMCDFISAWLLRKAVRQTVFANNLTDNVAKKKKKKKKLCVRGRGQEMNKCTRVFLSLLLSPRSVSESPSLRRTDLRLATHDVLIGSLGVCD